MRAIVAIDTIEDETPHIAWLHTDHLLTARAATNADQNIIWRWRSDAFGVGNAQSTTQANKPELTLNLRFPGQYHDEENGLYYNYFRTYDPSKGRYTQSDPIGLLGGINTFGYGHNNPESVLDLLGLCGSGTQDGQAALGLISKYKDTIISAAHVQGVDPQHVASIIFQEKYHGVWASAKNGPAWAMIVAGANDASVGLAEMDINTAAGLLGEDPSTMTNFTRNQIIQLLEDDQSAISLIALNVVSFQARLGRPVTLQEARYGHNAGVEALVRDMPITQGSPVSRRSWVHQDAISDALK